MTGLTFFSPEGFQLAVERSEDIKAPGAFFDQVEIMQIIGSTPSSAIVHYRLRRRQDGAHSRPWDHRVAIVVRGVISHTIPVPH